MAGNLALTDDLIKATVDFAAAQQIDLRSAFNLVGKSIGSNLNALGRYGIEIDTSASRSEKMAAITEVLSEKFDGAAAAQAKGLGSLKQLSNAFGDFLEIIGKQLAPAVTFLAQRMTEMLATFDPRRISGFFESIAVFGVNAKAILLDFIDSAVSIPNFLVSAAKAAKAALTLNFTEAKRIMKEHETIRNEISEDNEKVRMRQVAAIRKTFGNQDIVKAKGLEKKKTEIATKSIKETIGQKKKSDKEARDEDFEMFVERLEIEKNMAKRALDLRVRNREKADQKERERLQALQEEHERQVKAAIGSVQAFTQGGFQGVASHALGFISDTFMPGMSGAIQSTFNLLTQDSDKFIQSITQMFSAEFLGNIFRNITLFVEMLPGLINDVINFIADNMPAIIERLVAALIASMPEISVAFSKALITTMSDPRFIAGLAAAIAKGFATGIKDAASDIKDGIKDGFIDGVKDAANQIRKEIKNAVEDAFSLDVGGGGGGGLGGFVGKVSDVARDPSKLLGRAHGGWIPGYQGGGLIDNTLARVTPGEFVVNRASAQANAGLLEDINNSNGRSVGGGGGVTIVVNGGMLGDVTSARQFAKAVDEQLFRLRQGRESRAFDDGLF
jgi:hypothetical protein